MKQFNLSEWLANPSRKVVTRDGRPVRIVCWDVKQGKQDDNYVPILALIDKGEEIGETSFYYTEDGKFVRKANQEHSADLFFSDEELVPIQDTKAYQEGVKEGRRLEREDLEKIIEDKVAEKVAELLSKQPNPYTNPFQPISVLYGCPTDYPDITYTKTQARQ